LGLRRSPSPTSRSSTQRTSSAAGEADDRAALLLRSLNVDALAGRKAHPIGPDSAMYLKSRRSLAPAENFGVGGTAWWCTHRHSNRSPPLANGNTGRLAWKQEGDRAELFVDSLGISASYEEKILLPGREQNRHIREGSSMVALQRPGFAM